MFGLGKIFGKPKEEPSARSALDKMQETREMLEKKTAVLERKIDEERLRAQTFLKAKNKRAAIQCLKKKKQLETQLEHLNNYVLRLQEQEGSLESVNESMMTISAMKDSASAMKAIQRKTNIDDVDKTLDEINEQSDNLRTIQESLSQPLGAAAQIDEDELLAELEELDALELDESLLQPAAVAAGPSRVPAPAISEPRLPSVPTSVPKIAQPAKSEEDDELEKLRAEMAM